MEIVFFLEELSAKVFLDEFLPSLLPVGTTFRTIPHQGKSDLQKSLPIKLRAWRDPQAKFVILQDKDSNDCISLKQSLRDICRSARPDLEPLIRIACHELESWYLGDFDALEAAFPSFKANKVRERAKYRNVDLIANAAEEVIKLVPEYQKVSGSRKLGAALTTNRNSSHSFRVFVAGLMDLLK
jgi:hypothetical protein